MVGAFDNIILLTYLAGRFYAHPPNARPGSFPRSATMGKELTESSIKKIRPSVYLYRAGAACVRAHVTGTSPEIAARGLFGSDLITGTVLRSATSQATLGTPAWAGALGQAAVDDSIQAIATLSAGAALIQRGMKIDFAGRASIRIPGRVLDASDAGQWTGEGKPIEMRSQRMTSGPTLTPHKLCVLTSYTREQAEHSAIEQISRALISESTGLALDKTLFGTQADDGITPGGLLNGATQVTGVATGGGATGLAAESASWSAPWSPPTVAATSCWS